MTIFKWILTNFFKKIIYQLHHILPSIIDNLFKIVYVEKEQIDSTFNFIISTNNLDPSITHSLFKILKVYYGDINFLQLPKILSFYINKVIFVDNGNHIKNMVKIFIEEQIIVNYTDEIRQTYDLFGIIIHHSL